MKQTLLLFACFYSSLIFAQTKEIAHKSHSGQTVSFNNEAEGNFGDPFIPMTLDTVFKLTDTSVIEIKRLAGVRYVDTVTNHSYIHNPQISWDKITNYYFPNTVFIGFEVEQKMSKLKQLKEERKQKKKGSLIFPILWIGGMSGLLLMVLCSMRTLGFYRLEF